MNKDNRSWHIARFLVPLINAMVDEKRLIISIGRYTGHNLLQTPSFIYYTTLHPFSSVMLEPSYVTLIMKHIENSVTGDSLMICHCAINLTFLLHSLIIYMYNKAYTPDELLLLTTVNFCYKDFQLLWQGQNRWLKSSNHIIILYMFSYQIVKVKHEIVFTCTGIHTEVYNAYVYSFEVVYHSTT